jgi:trimeric autotransporter adhesin
MTRGFVRIVLGLLVVCAWSASVGAQQFTGGVRGAVRDANGVIPGAAVTLTNEATNISREVVTNDVGQYNFPAVPPGTYTLKSQIAGFKTFESKGVVVGTQQFVTLDVVLAVGAIEENVTVTGQTPLIETANASTGGVLDNETLQSLPAPGRNAFLIGVTVPTVMPVGDPQFNRQQDQSNASIVSIGGGGLRANNYLLDGVPISELRGRAVLNPTIEAVEEVKVQVHTYDGEMGRTGGGVFNVTLKSGTNSYHGSGFYQTRPVWGQSENFFNTAAGVTKQESGLADAYYRLYGGGAGGPIVKNRTFFWAATEGYRSGTTRNEQELWPSLNQRNGDFSRTTSGGAPVVLYNPWCRGAANARCPAAGTGSIATGGLFTGAIIPLTHPAVSPVGLNILKLWPTETINGTMASNEDGNTNANGTAFVVDKAQMYTFKAEHKFTDNWSLSGLYIYNKTDEPGSTIMKADKLFMADQDQWFGPLRRRPHVLVFNNTSVINSTTVLTLRYGWSTWQDSCDAQPFSAGLQSLGFSNNYVNALAPGGKETFPSLTFDSVEGVGGWGPVPVRWKGPYAINGALSKLWGNHSVKIGADLRRLGVALNTEAALGGSFGFNSLFTSRNGVGGNEVASLLLGLPSTGSVPANSGQGEWYTRYWGAYIQDDWRVTQKFTLNYGLRLEHEDGLREIDNHETVGFDQNATNPIDALVPKAGTLLAGKTLKGGLLYAGVNGAADYQGNPKKIKPAPRIGATYAIDTNTVIRGGYGLYWAPWNYPSYGGFYGQNGFSRTTRIIQLPPESAVPSTTLDNPFPSGLLAPVGSSLGLLTSVGSQVDFIDQAKGSPQVHQYSVDVQRELPGHMAVTIGYIGATGRDIGYGGIGDAAININQIDPAVARQLFPAANGGWDAAKLRELVPNPFFGIAAAGELASASQIARGQLLRPFPEFGDVFAHQTTAGSKRQYNAVSFELDKRTGQGWWGGRLSYTFSQTKDNQFAESNGYAWRTATPQNNYDLAAEYSTSIYDSPHRIILAPLVRFPSPKNQNSLAYTLAGGWNASAVIEAVSGGPLTAVMSSGTSDANLGLFGGRQRPNLIGDPNTTGSDDDRVASAAHASARYFNSTAFKDPGVGAYGNAPRTDPDARFQFRKNVDLVLSKDTKFAGNQIGQIRFEILNLTNTAKFGNDSNNNAIVNSASFGRVGTQVGFMRIWQLTFRYRF